MTAAKKDELKLLVANGTFIGEFEQNPELVQVVPPVYRRMPTMPYLRFCSSLEKKRTHCCS